MTKLDERPITEPASPQSPVPPTPTSPPSTRDSWLWGAVAIAMACALVTVVAVGLAFRYAGEEDGAASSGATASFDIELGDLFVRPSSIDVPRGSTVELTVTNNGAMAHDLKLDGTEGTDMLQPGDTAQVTFGPFDANAQAWCTVPGHKQAGMVLDINVTGAEPAAGAASATDTDVATGAAIDFNADPGAGWRPFDPRLQPAPGGTEHQIALSASETVIEVAPGVTQELWTFNGQYPGPILRGKVGDIFTVTLTNDGKIGHSIDFHASKVAWNDEMRTIQPGESLVYQFEAKHAGIFMYHCGTAPALHHIGNGMFGALIIDPPDLPPVDHEFVFVQSELYTGPEGGPGDLTKMQNDNWDAVVWNGYVNQYQHAPIRVEPGERVRAWVLDAGPSENSSFHIVGTVFDTVYREGTYVLRPDAQRGGAQALDLQPAQGGFVEFSFDEPGLYLIVTHKFSNVGKGALGVFEAGEVEAGAAGH